MNQISLSPHGPTSLESVPYAMSQEFPVTALTSATGSQDLSKEMPQKSTEPTGVSPHSVPVSPVVLAAPVAKQGAPLVTALLPQKVELPGFSNYSYTTALIRSGNYTLNQIVEILDDSVPEDALDYTEHLFKLATLVHEGHLSEAQLSLLVRKFSSLVELLPKFVNTEDPADSKLYLLVERCFDIFVKISTGKGNVLLATLTIRFLTSIMMNLNYWEIYNLLRWKPAIYQFLTLIQFDLTACYGRFIRDYLKYSYRQALLPEDSMARAAEYRERHRRLNERRMSRTSSPDLEGGSEDKTPLYYMNKEISEDHDRFVSEQLAATDRERNIPRERRKIRVDSKLAAHRIIKKPDIKVAPSSRSSNYDPDVVHECQLPSPDEPDKICLRRFSRKYELIRHQETVHSKKKKLFKCFVCVKQDPTIGPRIFTRHDTLAKHIRVNHRISGKEAKAEVAYSKKHAEIVEEGDITVHVGRRKTKVDFELRAHMERKGSAREAPDGSIIFEDMIDSPDSLDSGEENEIYDEID